jgi:hypothetical protein
MSNKEFRMMKSNNYDSPFGVHHSLFEILRFALEFLCGSYKNHDLIL